MRAVDVIQKKRDGHELTPGRDRLLRRRLHARRRSPTTRPPPWLMAVFFKGMTAGGDGRAHGVDDAHGRGARPADLPGPKVDKHSTGGVGDKTSLVLAPLAAACGVVRADDLGPRPRPHRRHARQARSRSPASASTSRSTSSAPCSEDVKLGLIGQTPEIAPADGKLYALRDVTGTVESVPLIAASIMSKKMAEGIDALVLDVKAGDGAFMKTRRRLARAGARRCSPSGDGDGQEGRGRSSRTWSSRWAAPSATRWRSWSASRPCRARAREDLRDALRRAGGLDAEPGRRVRRPWRPRAPACARRSPPARASGSSRRSSGSRAAIPACATTSRACRGRAETVELRAESAGRVTGIACRAVGTAAMLLGAGARDGGEHGSTRRGARAAQEGRGRGLRRRAAGHRARERPPAAGRGPRMLRRAIRVGPEAPPPRPLVHAVLAVG